MENLEEEIEIEEMDLEAVDDQGGALLNVTFITRAANPGGGDLQVAAVHLPGHQEDLELLHPARGHHPSELNQFGSC